MRKAGENASSTEDTTKEKQLYNCLRKERVIIKLIPKATGMVQNPKHVLFGGMAESASRTFVVPRLLSGIFINVLTDEEKEYLEEIMGLESNALSIYKKVDNFWDDSNTEGINKVTLHKQDNYLDLSVPEDYIRYKILLANKNNVAPSMQALQDYPKATYQFVIVSEGDADKQVVDKMNNTMKCYKEYGKYEDNIPLLKLVIETLDGRPISKYVKKEWIQSKINDLIQANNKMFLRTIEDPSLTTKVLIRESLEAGTVSKRGDYWYLRKDGTPLCEDNEEPTLNIAAKFLNQPKHQEVKFYLEAQLKEINKNE